MDPINPRKEDPPTANVGAVAAAARILNWLGQAETPLRLTQISRPLGINTSTCLNILRTLVNEGLVRGDAAAKTYTLGRGIVGLARNALKHAENLDILRPAMESIAKRHGITVLLWGRLDPEHLILLATAVGEPLRSIHVELGIKVPILSGSMGRLYAADFDMANLQRVFDATTWFNATTWRKPIAFSAFTREVDEATRRGWSLDTGTTDSALWGIAAPVSYQGEKLDRVVSAVMLAGQHNDAAINQIAAELLAVGDL